MGHQARLPKSLEATLAVDRGREQLVSEAWRLVKEALDSGRMTLKNGKVCGLEPRDQLRHVQWLASMSKQRRKLTPLPKDIFLHPTG